MDQHVVTAGQIWQIWRGAVADGETAIGQVGTGKPGYGQGCGWFARGGGVHGQPGIAGSALSIDPREIESTICDAPDCRVVAGMKSDDRAPNVRCGMTIINEKGIGARPTNEEIRSGAAIEYIVPGRDL